MTKVSTPLRTVLAIFAMILMAVQNQAAEPVIQTTTKAYGFAMSNKPYGIFSFDIKKPGSPTMLYQQEYKASAGAFARGKYYAMLADESGKALGIFSFDLKTGERKQLNDMSDAPSIFYDMTYDYTTSTMYAVADDYPATAFLKIDLATGNHTFIKNIEGKILWTIAADSRGKLYSTGSDGTIYNINKATGELTALGKTDIFPSSLQSMDFDYNTDRLYWSVLRYGTCQFYEVNLDDFSLRTIGTFPSGYQVGGLFMAFTEAGPKTPDAVSGLKADYDAQGRAKATISWTNPDKTFEGGNLSSLTYAEIYRNDTLVGKVENIQPGKISQWTDANAPTRSNIYKIIANNSDGAGMSSRVTVFTGHDVPGAPLNLKAELIGTNSIKLNWNAPATGLNNGWFDKSTLSYTVLRKPDNVSIATSLKEITFTDNSITSYAAYSYEITAVSADGNGGVSLSPLVTAGESILMPFKCPFDNENDFKMWSNFDLDGNGETWYWGKVGGNKNGAESRANTQKSTNNWLISPPLTLETGKVYELSLMAYTAYYEADSIRITLGKENKPDAQTLVIYEASIKNYYGQKVVVTLPELSENGKYYLGLNHIALAPKGMVIHVNDLLLKEQDKGSVSGTVTDGTNPLANVTVTLNDNTYSTQTDAQGKYQIKDIMAGKYTLRGTLLGYGEKTSEITIVPLKETVTDLTLNTLPVHKFTGKVADKSGKPIGGAKVALSGYNTYSATSNLSGEFAITGVFASDSYKLTVSKNNFAVVESPITFSSDVNRSIELNYKPVAPYKLTAKDTENTISLTWTSPIDLNTYKYDNGTPDSYLGYDEGGEYHVIGSVYRIATTLYKVKWFTMPNPNKKPYVHLYIFALDQNGNPTADALFMQKNIPTVDYEWTTFELPNPVAAPNGFLLALSSEGNVSLGTDTGNPDGSIEYPHTQCYSTNYEYAGSYRYIDDSKKTYRFMLRAEGEPIEDKNLSTPVEATYDVWRLKDIDKNSPDKWTKLTSNLTVLSFKDQDASTLPQGVYQYAVKANYPVESSLSEPTLSNLVNYKMYTRVTLNVIANSAAGDANGAQVFIKDNQGHEYTLTVAANKAVFEKVWKGTYYLTLTQPGFTGETNKKISVDKESEYTFSYTLVQKLDKPQNIDILATDKAWVWKLIWDADSNIEEGFEDKEAYQDFEINPAGKIGWQYIDGDGLPTYGFSSTIFPGIRSKMAAIVFDPSKTEPVLNTPSIEGERMLAFFCASEAYSNDYLISPPLDFYKDYTFSFYAKTYDSDYGLERIRVGYSLTDTNPDNFIWLDENLVDVPVEITHYSYTIPKNAKYVVLNSQSPNGFILFVDDIFIGINRPAQAKSNAPASAKKYKVYLDNKLVSDTNESTYILSDLSKGDHKAGVTHVYETGESEPITVTFTVTDENGIENVKNTDISVYLTKENHLFVRGEYSDIALFTVSGNEIPAGKKDDFTDLSQLSDGIYMVRITDMNQQVSYYKIVK